MDAKTFQLELVTPAKLVYTGEAVAFSAPGTEGYFQILGNHTPYIVTMQIGEIVVRTPDEELKFATSGGFAEVSANKVSILAETAEKADEIDYERVSNSKKRAEERLENGGKDVDSDRAKLALFRSLNRIKVSSRVTSD